MMQRSACLCPSMAYQLAGAKTVQSSTALIRNALKKENQLRNFLV